MNIKKYAIGFAVFMIYYLVARNIENKLSAVKNLANFGTSQS